MSDRRTRRREATRVKLQSSAERRLEPGETIRLWVLGMSAPIPSNPIEGLINLFRLAGGQARPLGVLVTDRAVHLARTGWFKSQVRDLLASYPLKPKPPHVAFDRTDSAIIVNDTTVHLPSGQFGRAEEIAREIRDAGR